MRCVVKTLCGKYASFKKLVRRTYKYCRLVIARKLHPNWRLAQDIDDIRKIPFIQFVFCVFPYARVRAGSGCSVGFDVGKQLSYVIHNGYRLYFRDGFTECEVRDQYLYFCEVEGITGQGCLEKTPHSYVSESFNVEQGDVVVDLGCSEALFALDNIEKASRVYLFEMDLQWNCPLHATFDRFGDKVVITNKFVGGVTSGDVVRMTDVLEDGIGVTYFLKMDIEGGERAVIESSRDFLTSHRVKLSCCVYHRQDDERVITEMLKNMGFTCSVTDGCMLPPMGGMHYPYLRHGVIHAQNF